MSRILWIANAPWAGSGYGMQTALFTRRLRALGHDVAIAANFGLAGAVFTWQGMTVYPFDSDHGNRGIVKWAEHHEADLVVFLCDAWVLHPEKWGEELEIPVAVWAPVDHYPIPPAVFAVLDHDAITPIAMSQFGCRMMDQVTLEHLYVPHGVDTAVFSPRRETRDAIRDELGIPRDAFLVGMVAANAGSPQLPRKAFPEAFLAFAGLAHDRDDAWLYVHSDAIPKGMGINLERCATMAGVPMERLRFPDASAFQLGLSPDLVSHLYQTFDVLLHASMGEGFGIASLEAVACGVPVITSNHSAMPELLGAGWLVDGQPHWDALSDAWFFCPSVKSIRARLEEAYEARDDLELRARAVEFAQTYDANRVTLEYWLPALDALGCKTPVEKIAELAGVTLPAESRQARRARERREAKARA